MVITKEELLQSGIFETAKGYGVSVWDQGYVHLCELKNGEWQDCCFDTLEEAYEAQERYYGWESHDVCIVDTEAIAYRYYDGKINSVDILGYPKDIDFVEIDELRRDLSNGAGNVLQRFFYVPAMDILCIYGDY